MDQAELFLLIVAVIAFFTVRWSLRLAAATTELPVKSVLALLLAAMVGLQPLFGYHTGDLLHWLALVAAPIWTFGPLAAVGLARSRQYRAAGVLVKLLYWSDEGRQALNRLLAQVALQQGDAAAAERLGSPDEPLLALQAATLREDWSAVEELARQVQRTADNSSLADAALVRAYIAQGRLELAQQALETARQRIEADPARQGPISYRALRLSEARLAAEYGDVNSVRRLLQQLPQGTPAWMVYEIVARAAERAQRSEEAASLYAHAFLVAPEGIRERLGRELSRLGRPLPRVKPRRAAVGTMVLAGALVLLYIGQEVLNARFGPLFAGLRPSDLVAAYMQNVPGIATADAPWRHVSYAFVHGNLIHIGFNTWVLFDLGRVYEARRHWGSLLMAFLFGTVMGAYLTGIAQPGQVQLLIGASGGVLGVGGALLADSLRSGLASDRQLTRSLLQWVVLIVLFSVAIPNVSLWGHVGGLVGGLLWGFMRQGLPGGLRTDRFAGGVAAGVLLYVLFIVLTQVGRLV